MDKPTVAVSDCVFPDLNAAREILAGIGAELVLAGPTRENFIEVASNADGLLVTYAPIDRDIIGALKKCRIIARFGIGVDNIDLEAATAAGILVTNVPDYCIDEVADHSIALLLALIRKISSSNADTHAGGWDMRTVTPIRRVRGSTLGLVGFGQIAQAVARRALAFGCEVITSDPNTPPEFCSERGVRLVSFAELLANSDYVSIHCPLVPSTERLFREETLRQMRPSAYLVNTARGAIVDEGDLANALSDGIIGGAALDVRMVEPPPPNSPLLGRRNVILTPHTSFYSSEAMLELQRKAADEVVRRLRGIPARSPMNCLNVEPSELIVQVQEA